MNTQNKISACWIVKNEEANLKRSIESLKGFADEFLVVDTGSTDGSKEVAESLGARVIDFEWVGDFSAARNFTIEKAAGEIIVFLDADQWTEPPLGEAERKTVLDLFAGCAELDVITVVVKNIDINTGRLISTNVENRIFRKRDGFGYAGIVHEYLHGIRLSATISTFCVYHSGYSKEIIGDKIERNVALLEEGLAASAEGSRNWVRFRFYLLREYDFHHRTDEAAVHLKELLKHPGAIKRLCAFHDVGFTVCLYTAIHVAAKRRDAVSRLDVYKKLFGMFAATYPRHPGTAEIELLYQALFDMKEDRYLREFGPAIALAQRLHKTETVSYYKDYERFLYEKAALAAWRRGDLVRAMEWSLNSLKGEGRVLQSPFGILMSVIRNQPAQDILMLLNTVYKMDNPADLDILIRRTRIDGLRDVNSFYVKKRMDLGAVRVEDTLRLMLAHGLYDGALATAGESRAAGSEVAAQYAFAAAICGASQEAVDAHKEMLAPYSAILEAYKKGESLAKVDGATAKVFMDTYSLIAFAAGFETADKYRRVFADEPVLCFRTKAAYCEESHCLDRILDEDMAGIAPSDYSCRRYRAAALTAATRYDEAYAEIEVLLGSGSVEQDLLHALLVVAEKSGGDTAQKARALYDRYIVAYDKIIDLGDVVRTGVTIENEAVIKRESLKKMTAAQFDELTKGESEQAAPPKLLDITRKAAVIYKHSRMLPEAVRCYIRLLAHGVADEADKKNLSEIFAGVKNSALTNYF